MHYILSKIAKSQFNLRDYKLPETKVKIIAKNYPELSRQSDIDFDIYNLGMIFHDKKTRELIQNGQTIGCFYIESPGMRSLLKRLDCDNFEMLTAASSVIRPGVAESGMMQEFIARHKDPSRRSYLLPEMEKYLGETYGVMIYQEDVIKVCHHIAGLTLEESDLLHRAMSGKMRSKSTMERIANRFYSSSIQRGKPEDITKELWRQISSFAGYAFCKAHSASFAQLSYQCAYLKAHYPAEFMANVLSNGGGFYSAAVYLQESRRMGSTVLLPCVNRSEYVYTGLKDKIRIGFMAVKNLSRPTIDKIIDERDNNGKYKNYFDFMIRTNIGPEELKNLDTLRCS